MTRLAPALAVLGALLVLPRVAGAPPPPAKSCEAELGELRFLVQWYGQQRTELEFAVARAEARRQHAERALAEARRAGRSAMSGRRLGESSASRTALAPGEYLRDHDGTWWVRPPVGPAMPLTEHTVTEHDDGTITVEPWIIADGWLGWLERGVWQSAR
jgi:hypothetical protein